MPRGTAASLAAEARRPRLAYFVNLFPNLIETMIYREVGALRAMGWEIATFSVRRPPREEVSREAWPFFEGTRYILPMPAWRMVGRHLAALARRPWRYWTTLGRCLVGTHGRFRDRARTAAHFAEAIAVLPEVRRTGVEHLHAHWATGPATIAMVLSRMLDLPFSFTAHAYDIWREQLLLGEKLGAAAFAVTCTDCNRRHLIATYGVAPERVVTVHHGVDVSRFAPAERSRARVPHIVSVGRLVEQKGFDRLVRACRRLTDAGVAFTCEIIGDGPLEGRLDALIAEQGLRGQVTLAGRLFQEEVLARYAAADVFALYCVPSSDQDRDGIPNVLIEAMASELPVVSTRFSGVPELVVDGETGILVEPDDDAGQADALRRLVADPALRRRMGRAGRERVLAGFTTEGSAARLAAVFAERGG
ncbi:MAG TPA: glycosyltransferase family 4 protein [Candidatus Binatia bacterium]|nr:glycosyltransferase family 4 protein [Candidatus Binatia bacterium]